MEFVLGKKVRIGSMTQGTRGWPLMAMLVLCLLTLMAAFQSPMAQADSLKTATDLAAGKTPLKITSLQYRVNGGSWKEVPKPRDHSQEYPIVVPLNATVDFKAAPGSLPEGKSFSWTGVAPETIASSTGSIQDKASQTFSAASSSMTDYKTVTASFGNSIAADIVVVKIDKLKYRFDDPDTTADDQDPFVDVPNPLAVPVGSTVVFQAVKSPEAVSPSLPTGKCVWSGTAGASGSSVIVHNNPADRDIETKSVTFNSVTSDAPGYKTVTAECGNSVTVNVLVTESYAKLHIYKDNDGEPGEEIVGSAPVIGGKVWAALEISVGAGQQVDDALSSVVLRRREDSTSHTSADDHIDTELSLSGNWEKWDGTNWGGSGSPNTANTGTEAARYRKTVLWTTTASEQITGQKLWGHNGKYEVKLLQNLAFEPAGGGTSHNYNLAQKTPAVENLVFDIVGTTGKAATNLSADYFIFDPDSTIATRQQPKITFKIKDDGDPHQYKWKIYLHPTWLPYNSSSSFPDHPYTILSGSTTAPGTVETTWNGHKDNGTGDIAASGIYTFDIYVEEVANTAGASPILDHAEMKAPYGLHLNSPYTQIHKSTSTVTQLQVGYSLLDESGKNASKVQMDVRDDDWSLLTSVTNGLPTTSNQDHGPINAWTIPAGTDPWDLRTLFVGEDGHGTEQRDHQNLRTLATRQAQRIVGLQYRLNYEQAWEDVPQPGDTNYPLTVDQYTYVDFRAMKANPDLPWPEGKPEWGGEYWDGEIGEQSWEYFDQVSEDDTDLFWVTAECGNEITADVAVKARTSWTLYASSDKDSILAGGTTTLSQSHLQAEVYDENGDPVPNVSVTYTTSLGTVASATVTDSQGVSEAVLTAGNQIDKADVTISVATNSGETMVRHLLLDIEPPHAEVVITDADETDVLGTATCTISLSYDGISLSGRQIKLIGKATSDEDGENEVAGSADHVFFLAPEGTTDADGNYSTTISWHPNFMPEEYYLVIDVVDTELSYGE